MAVLGFSFAYVNIWNAILLSMVIPGEHLEGVLEEVQVDQDEVEGKGTLALTKDGQCDWTSGEYWTFILSLDCHHTSQYSDETIVSKMYNLLVSFACDNCGK